MATIHPECPVCNQGYMMAITEEDAVEDAAEEDAVHEYEGVYYFHGG